MSCVLRTWKHMGMLTHLSQNNELPDSIRPLALHGYRSGLFLPQASARIHRDGNMDFQLCNIPVNYNIVLKYALIQSPNKTPCFVPSPCFVKHLYTPSRCPVGCDAV